MQISRLYYRLDTPLPPIGYLARDVLFARLCWLDTPISVVSLHHESSMYRIFWLIPGLFCAACASSGNTAQSAYRDYISSCRDQRSEHAAELVRETVVEPCPDETKSLPPDASFENIATVDAFTFIDSGNGYHLDAHRMLNTQSLGSVILRIKYALYSRDAEEFYANLAPSLQQHYPGDQLPEKIQSDPDLNALYAALAASSLESMQCAKQSSGVHCLISGMFIDFILVEDNWKLASFGI